MYKYETHLHTAPVSKCAAATVKENLDFYKSKGYDGVFITNHFLDGNINISASESYEKRIRFYFSDYENALVIGKEIGLKVFLGIEISYRGTDFLVYGLDKQWFLEHPEMLDLPVKAKLQLLMENGGYVIHAHPFREARYIDHIRLYPRSVNAVEVLNACRTDFENNMALQYANSYGLAQTAGTDNHAAGNCHRFSGVLSETPINSESEYIECVKNGKLKFFTETP